MPENEQTDEAPKVVATLYAPEYNGTRLKIQGRSGAWYTFSRSPDARRGLFREYTSLEQFAREELDIRRSRVNPHIICTLTGNMDPVLRAKEAVETLIRARKTVPDGRRLTGLTEIYEMAFAAANALIFGQQELAPTTQDDEQDTQGDEVAASRVLDETTWEQAGPVVEQVQQEEDAPKGAEAVTTGNGQPVVAVASTEAPQVAGPSTDYTEEYLADTLAWGAFRKLAADEFGVSKGTRAEMVAEVLKIQAERKG